MTASVRAVSLATAAILGLAARSPAQEKTSEPPPAQADAKADSAPEAPASDKPQGDAAPAASKDQDKAKRAETPGKIEKATFGGGCFWCTEAVFERIPGVKSVVSGFAGGTLANPTYEMVCTGLTGHAEVVQIEFDPAQVSYEKLIRLFFASHDPTTWNSQGPDYGTQYRSIILYHSDEQKQVAQQVYKDLTARKAFRRPIVTELVPFKEFYPAERYHQDYYRNHPYAQYSQIYIAPKVKKLKAKLAQEAKAQAKKPQE